ncbi:MAG: helicase-exonuclease AddAB subunit AddA [Clostridia bacterium]|nr:helicase-exonuclease AddAB subunit AddA [Clostridia bacterium]
MSRQWTNAQQNAIDSRNGSVLVSAAAGSGKTAVLVERVIKRITDKQKQTNIEKILVVTFTKAAAGEMLERISKSLNELIKENPKDSFLKRQKMFLPNANISTIDSFCNQLVKENCQLLRIVPDFKMLNENELKLLHSDIITEVLDEIYSENTPEINALLELFNNGRSDFNLIQSIFSIYNFSISSANPEKWIKDHFAYYFEDVPVEKTVWGEYSLKRVREVLEHIIIKCDKILLDGGDDNKVGVTARNSISSALAQMKYAVELIDNGGNWDEIRQIVNNLTVESFGRFKPDEKDDHYYDIQGRTAALKKDFASLAKIMTCDSEDFAKDIEKLRPVMSAFQGCVLRFSSKLAEAKKEKNSYDFSDILHMALKLLISYDENGNPQKTPLAIEMSELYDEILIDEFQDTNEAQDALFNAISKNSENLFMVGDVKQSIYGFRQAMPEIFMGYKDRYDDYDKNIDNYPAKIVLDKNFRSRKGIVDGVNFFFDYLMTRKMGEIDYKNGDQLVFGASFSETENKDVHLHIVSGTDSRKSNFHEEVQYVGEKIQELVESKMTVGNKDNERELKYSDICILMRGLKSKAEEVTRIFSEMGIPVRVEKKNGFFDNPEIVTMISLLSVIDNPVQDVPLVSVMLSPLFPFDENDLARMRCDDRKGTIYDLLKANYNKNDNVKHFLDTIYQLRMLSVTHSVGELIRRVFEITAYDSVVGAMNNGDKRVLNLQLLISYAEDFEKNGGHGLPGFIRYVDKLRKNNFDLKESNLVNENDNAVQLTTIHGSKGLEYPVVFIMGTGDYFGGGFGGDKTVVERSMGLGTVCYDSDRNLEYKTQPYSTIKLKKYLDELNEEMRIYYVAMTRAREKLYITGNLYKPESKIKEIYDRFYTGDEDNSVALSMANSFLQWAILSVIRHPSAKQICKDSGILNDISKATESKIDFQIVTPSLCEIIEEESETEKAPVDNDLLETINEKVSYTYPYAEYTRTAIKYSASRIDKENETLYIATESPAFLGKGELTPAQRGTLLHKFMEKCNFNKAKESVENEILRLISNGVFTQTEADSINTKSITKFFESDLYKRIDSADEFVREKEFTMSVPLSFVRNDLKGEWANEKVVVQGIIDGLIINGNKGEIVDYKTDKVISAEELCDKYREQMRVYKKAAVECFGLDNVTVTLYSFSLSKEISVKLEKNT